ncbi:MAG: hypothetical protein ACREMP_01830 [Candidatus Tyrphobacter sp.]
MIEDAAFARIHQTRVVARREPADGVVVLTMQAPDLARCVRPGQFVMAIPPSAAAASVALGVYDVAESTASLLFFIAGKRTKELASLRPNDALALAGPLGNGFDLSGRPRDVAIVAGGVGIASVLLAAKELVLAGSRVRLMYGARTAARLVERDRFEDLGCAVAVATEDASAGLRGYATALFERAQPPQLVLACGPTPMLKATAKIALAKEIEAQLSLEETFACGIGGCWGCVVPIDGNSAQAPHVPATQDGVVNARICREGPVFSARELRW